MKSRLFIASLPCFLLLSCASLSNDLFLARNVDARLKSEAASAQGVRKYEEYLEAAGDYAKVGEIRRYFVVALAYDPANAEAGEYLAKVEGYTKDFVGARLATAERLLAKSPREEKDDYAILVALQSAQAAEPSNEKAAKLLRDQKEAKARLSALYLERSLSAQALASPPAPKKGEAPAKSPSAPEREAAWVDCYLNASKALAVDPASAKAAKAKSASYGELEKAFGARAALVESRIGAAKFDEAKAEHARLASFDKSLESPFSKKVDEIAYRLYLAWAKALEAKKDYPGAREKVEAALALDRSEEALALQRRLQSVLASAEGEASFDASLAELDKLVAKGDLLQAQKRLEAAAKATKDPARKAKLDERRAKLRSGLKPFYDKGVAAYRAENFKLAIEQLSVVVAISPSYEQAADYLEKAKEKQKLVDQFTK